ncbi:MAG: bifunctional acetate--CoA ligase family protein/GNAT family N-acetyltransferase [Rhodocyclaceae bacterium]|nr:bifunctional acetate--CoA ligase family protein/GNAT family N-acetyltransferase [Rhodocyclaceae bacterium]
MHEHHYLKPLFEPRAVAIVGASEQEGTTGCTVMRNMLDSCYQGKLFAVAPDHETMFGVPCFRSVEDIPQRLDLAVITSPAADAPRIVESCGRAGVKTALVMSEGFSEAGPRGLALERSLMENARHHRVRLIGPRCLGVLRPSIGLAASFAGTPAHPGSIGFIAQSGALTNAVLDWAYMRGVGFSSVVAVGASADVDFGEVLDYMVQDNKTENIIVVVERIRQARGFMSALRAAARSKPVLVMKTGRHPDRTGTPGATGGADDVFDAALRRAGVVRLYTLGQLFAVAGALVSHFRPRGNRLAIVSNGHGPAVMAADLCADLGIPLAGLAQSTVDNLNAALHSPWSRNNPVDLRAADPESYRAAVKACLTDPNVDGVLTIFAPQAQSMPTDVARAVSEAAREGDKPVLTCWMGGEQVKEARTLTSDKGIPTFSSPEPAVELFHNLSSFYRNQQLLRQAPGSLSHLDPPSIESARLVMETALSEKRYSLNEIESKALLAAFRIPIAPTVVARSATEAMVYAEELGLPVAMKIDSADITHKSDSGGVRLNVINLMQVRTAYQDILEDVKRNRPDATISGVAIEPMINKPNGRELFVGVFNDPVFGPTITFGEGGNRVEEDRDRAVSLPPLNGYLARDMIRSARVAQLLGEFRSMPPVAMDALELVLLRVSEMVCELPWIRELRINPLIVDENGAVAVDARVIVQNIPPTADRYDHMAIHPYPSNLESTWTMRDGTQVSIRPIRPEDAEMEREFVRQLSAETRYYRFMNTLRELPEPMVARLTQIDYDREMAYIATVRKDDQEVELGVCRYAVNPDRETCEFAIVVRDDQQGTGLARKLMQVLIETARDRRLKFMNGIFLSQNDRMLKFVQNLGFELSKDPDDVSLVQGVLALQ